MDLLTWENMEPKSSVSSTDLPLFDGSNMTQFPVNSTGTSVHEPFYVPVGIVVLLSFLYGSISAVAVVGNALVIFVITRNRRMRTVINFFIANLSVADLMIALLSTPFQFQAALLQRWDLPFILCPVAPFVKELSVNVSIATLAVISIDRFLAVEHPLRPGWSGSKAVVIMTVVWIVGITSSVPTAAFYTILWIPLSEDSTLTKPLCFPAFPPNFEGFYILYLVVMQYFLPLLVIGCAYSRIMYKIWFAKAPGSALDSRDKIMNKNKKKVIKMLVVVVALFAFCWLPLQLYHLFSVVEPNINYFRHINIIWFCSNWLAMSNSCYNPFIYGLFSEKFKHGFSQLFRRSQCRGLCCRRLDIQDDPFATEVSGISLRRTYSTAYTAHSPRTTPVDLRVLTNCRRSGGVWS